MDLYEITTLGVFAITYSNFTLNLGAWAITHSLLNRISKEDIEARFEALKGPRRILNFLTLPGRQLAYWDRRKRDE